LRAKRVKGPFSLSLSHLVGPEWEYGMAELSRGKSVFESRFCQKYSGSWKALLIIKHTKPIKVKIYRTLADAKVIVVKSPQNGGRLSVCTALGRASQMQD